MAKTVLLFISLCIIVLVGGCGQSEYRQATAADVVVGAKIYQYLSSDAIMREHNIFSTVTQVKDGAAYLDHGDGSGGWRSIEQLTTLKTFKNGSTFRYDVKRSEAK
ncbi:MAG: hypothetical protein ABFD96_08130 [Armatimonadia bacterium]